RNERMVQRLPSSLVPSVAASAPSASALHAGLVRVELALELPDERAASHRPLSRARADSLRGVPATAERHGVRAAERVGGTVLAERSGLVERERIAAGVREMRLAAGGRAFHAVAGGRTRPV